MARKYELPLEALEAGAELTEWMDAATAMHDEAGQHWQPLRSRYSTVCGTRAMESADSGGPSDEYCAELADEQGVPRGAVRFRLDREANVLHWEGELLDPALGWVTMEIEGFTPIYVQPVQLATGQPWAAQGSSGLYLGGTQCPRPVGRGLCD